MNFGNTKATLQKDTWRPCKNMAPARYIASLFAQWPRPKNPKALGRQAEKIAAIYLRLKGYKILFRNWRTRFGEIDLVAQRGSVVVLVEVKARRSLKRGSPEEALTPEKQKRLLRLAELYISQRPLAPRETLRLDVIAIDFSSKRPQIRHYPGAISF